MIPQTTQTPTIENYRAAKIFIKSIIGHKYKVVRCKSKEVNKKKLEAIKMKIFFENADNAFCTLINKIVNHKILLLTPTTQQLVADLENVHFCTGRTSELFLKLINLIDPYPHNIEEKKSPSHTEKTNEISKKESSKKKKIPKPSDFSFNKIHIMFSELGYNPSEYSLIKQKIIEDLCLPRKKEIL